MSSTTADKIKSHPVHIWWQHLLLPNLHNSFCKSGSKVTQTAHKNKWHYSERKSFLVNPPWERAAPFRLDPSVVWGLCLLKLGRNTARALLTYFSFFAQHHSDTWPLCMQRLCNPACFSVCDFMKSLPVCSFRPGWVTGCTEALVETHLCLFMWGKACFFVESRKNGSLIQYEHICVCLNTEKMHIKYYMTALALLS